jgi:hypothetical protein
MTKKEEWLENVDTHVIPGMAFRLCQQEGHHQIWPLDFGTKLWAERKLFTL